MAKGIILVESFPSSPDRDEEYNTWYDEVHLGELVALDGFVSARPVRMSRSMKSKATIFSPSWTT
jgi:hypothetical protein